LPIVRVKELWKSVGSRQNHCNNEQAYLLAYQRSLLELNWLAQFHI